LINVGPYGNSNAPLNIAAALSPDGRYVAFEAYDGASVEDLQTGTLTRVFTIPSDPLDPASKTYTPSFASVIFSPDSKRFAFVYVAPDPSNPFQAEVADTYVTDLTNGDQTQRMNLGNGAGSSNGRPEYTAPAFSADGRFLAFMDDGGNYSQALPYLYDFSTGARTAISFNPADGSPRGIYGGLDPTEHSYLDDGLAISQNGQFVAYRTLEGQVVVHDMWAGTTTVASSAPDGTDGNDISSFGSAPSFAADGSVLIFSSRSSNLYYQDRNGYPSNHSGGDDIFAYLQTVTPHASGVIAGTVTGPSGPLSGVTVYIDANHNGYADDPFVTTTAGDGTYSFQGVQAGTHSVVAYAAPSLGLGIPIPSQSVTLPDSTSAITNVNFTAGEGSMSGKVDVPAGLDPTTLGVYIDYNHDGKYDDAVLISVASDGTWGGLHGLPDGTYSVGVYIQQSGYIVHEPFSGFNDRRGNGQPGSDYVAFTKGGRVTRS